MARNKTSLLVGATGFIGRHLAAYLCSKGERVIGTYAHSTDVCRPLDADVYRCHSGARQKLDGSVLWRKSRNPEDTGCRVKPGMTLEGNCMNWYAPSTDRSFAGRTMKLVQCNVTSRASIRRLMSRFRPDFIYYLAAKSSVREAWARPLETIQTNFLGAAFFLEELRRIRSRARILIFSSGTAYGESHDCGKPLGEEACLRPRDIYSLTKTGIDFLGKFYGSVYGLRVGVVRLANLTGPGQSTTFSLANFASQIAKIESGRQEPALSVGNLAAARDYLDVRDGVRALYLAMRRFACGEAYNIASGTSRSLADVLKTFLSLSRLKQRKIAVVRREHFIPKDEIKAIRLSSSKLKRLSGWRPRIPFRKTLRDMLKEWRAQ